MEDVWGDRGDSGIVRIKGEEVSESRVLYTQEACAGGRPVVGRWMTCLGRWRLVAARFLGVIGF